MPDKEKKEFTFISEQIKKKPFYRKKWFIQSMTGIGLAVLFGGTAGVTFAVVMPWAQKQFGEPSVPQQIVITQDESEENAGDGQENEQEQQTESQTQKNGKQGDGIELSDYKLLYDKLYQVGSSVMTSVVTVIGKSSDVDWANEIDESEIQMSGLIFAENNRNYYILTETDVLEGAEQIIVKFCDGSSAGAVIQMRDSVTGTAVVSVPVSRVQKKTRDEISVAELGSSLDVRQGTPVISIGSPLGYSNAMTFGMVTSVTETSASDSQYTVLTTDIIGSGQGNGILADLDGNIIGIISDKLGPYAYTETITALGISDMKYAMESMCNNKTMPYLGITGNAISETVSRQNAVPQGIYIRAVEADSPAMHVGILAGIDILTEIQGEEVRTPEDYMTQLRKYDPGTILKLKLKRRGLEGYVDLEVEITVEARPQ